jgi:hypothetical protein
MRGAKGAPSVMPYRFGPYTSELDRLAREQLERERLEQLMQSGNVPFGGTARSLALPILGSRHLRTCQVCGMESPLSGPCQCRTTLAPVFVDTTVGIDTGGACVLASTVVRTNGAELDRLQRISERVQAIKGATDEDAQDDAVYELVPSGGPLTLSELKRAPDALIDDLASCSVPKTERSSFMPRLH